MIPFYRKLFEYDNWANGEIASQLASIEPTDEQLKKHLVHILASQFVWLNRLEWKSQSSPETWPEWSLQECQTRMENLRDRWQEILQSLNLPALYSKFRYQNSEGTVFETPIQDILIHAITHSSYQRSQIAKQVRQMDISPVNTDYITYIRIVDQ
ncbi:hypothetical protein GWO43_12635 [candidate division KSB1 bacterium]|nr:hypothetical protein [candidate division KSB1 bacterium]NIR71272.1 hypothetical protein [candidate division KSB1 bacterium]NIS24801.1 hypothetical protein [candidate division KSB1 bacterium]NIT71708.1 hypothetical protein [candidate division KSB1 bacterium]NIU25437.1 hypothetical protein [candidate division KSB1 bacterium]